MSVLERHSEEWKVTRQVLPSCSLLIDTLSLITPNNAMTFTNNLQTLPTSSHSPPSRSKDFLGPLRSTSSSVSSSDSPNSPISSNLSRAHSTSLWLWAYSLLLTATVNFFLHGAQKKPPHL